MDITVGYVIVVVLRGSMNNLKRYFKMLRWIWFNRGMNDLLLISIIPLGGLGIPFLVLMGIILSFCYTYLYLAKDERVHIAFYETIDRSGLYRCMLHNYQFNERYDSCHQEFECPNKVWQ